MPAFIRIALISLCVVFSAPLSATPQSRVLVDSLISQSGMDDLISQYPALIQQTLSRNLARQSLPPGMTRIFEQVVRGNFSAEALLHDFARELDSQLDESTAREALAWYSSPLGQKIVRAEMGAVTQDGVDIGLEQLREKYKGTERERLFAAFDRATASTETMLDNAQILQLAMAAAVTSVVHGPDVPTYQDLKMVIAKRRGQLRGQVGEQAYLNYLYTYRHLSLSELKAYIRFAKTPAGHAWVKAVNRALKHTLEARSDALSRDLARAGVAQRAS